MLGRRRVRLECRRPAPSFRWMPQGDIYQHVHVCVDECAHVWLPTEVFSGGCHVPNN